MNKMTFLLPEDVSREIEERTEHSRDKTRVVRHALSRYFTLLQHARIGLRPRFTKNECAIVLDAMNGLAGDFVHQQMLAGNVADAIALEGLDKKWGIDKDELLGKLSALTYTETVAILDACEQWWNRVAHGEQPGYNELLK